jgi:hypothetical protein
MPITPKTGSLFHAYSHPIGLCQLPSEFKITRTRQGDKPPRHFRQSVDKRIDFGLASGLPAFPFPGRCSSQPLDQRGAVDAHG